MSQGPLRLGVVGCGGFGLFALQQFAQVRGVKLAAMAGTYREAAERAARRFGIPEVETVEQMVARRDVDLVYVATPPFLHFEQAMLALRAGKHVLVEKPLAVSLEQADEMIAAARERDVLLAADLMQRYNPLYAAVRELVASGALGAPLRAWFENCASDEELGPDHWFWDRRKSGGIFIEHGVHFFDMFAGWFGAGRVVAAQALTRPGTAIEDQVHCTVLHEDGVLADFYHGFTQPGRMDRQELRILFERGDATLYGWVPVELRIHAIADEADTRAVCDLFPGARLDVASAYSDKGRACRARGMDLDVYQEFELTWGLGQRKLHRYGDLLRALLEDQVAWIRDRSHRRVVTEQNGRDSLALAVEADRLAHARRSGHGRAR